MELNLTPALIERVLQIAIAEEAERLARKAGVDEDTLAKVHRLNLSRKQWRWN